MDNVNIIAVISLIASVLGSLTALYIAKKKVDFAKRGIDVNLEKIRKEGLISFSDHQFDWVRELRDTLSHFHSIAMSHCMSEFYLNKKVEFTKEEQQKLYFYGNKIQLLMNPDDEEYSDLMKLVNNLVLSVCEPNTFNTLFPDNTTEQERHQRLAEIDDSYISISQRIVSREIERLQARMTMINFR